MFDGTTWISVEGAGVGGIDTQGDGSPPFYLTINELAA